MLKVFREQTADGLPDFIMSSTILWPNKAPEPTADSAASSASRATRLGRLWLSFRR